ncbi:MAG TPA: SMP-30/gluconolactonase/LRE family protein [Isosphaeraceae bacterium]|jgi:gluconolactonase|nr:SMP-30/gluconolactonase/LRE family protein [Isosphaeraceae bacterium]
MVPILRDAGLSALVAGDRVETLASGFQFTEGPLWCPDGSLLFQDIKAELTYRLGPDGKAHVVRDHTGAANGQTFAADGSIVFCEQNGRRISRMNLDGTGVEPLIETWQGKRLNSPNDIVCRSDGLIYFTDPPYGVQPEERALHFQGVYCIDRSGHLHLLADDFEKPNGLAFSPDEKTLYVCDTGRYHVRAFEVDSDGSLVVGSSRVFAHMDPEQPGGPDGMKVDREGRVYVAVALGVWVYEPDGRLMGILGLPKRPSNLAWWDFDGRALAITAIDTVCRVELKVAGVVPPFLPRG